MLFACEDKLICLVHFSRSARLVSVGRVERKTGLGVPALSPSFRSSSRHLSLYDPDTLKQLHSAIVDTSPQLLVPHFDYDSNVVFLTGKVTAAARRLVFSSPSTVFSFQGDRIVNMYEVRAEPPWLLQLASYTAPSGHQAFSIHQKNVADVGKVEFARGWRLTESSVESLSFTVPRVKVSPPL